ncbi:MAG: hypothetical protein ABIJ43_05865 [Candidatus Beckwithbacteria bacterium]|uniref:Uncharacterized protein n=1 Tax=viral metagenome TaxID=1070528 RepID=A0A6M3LH06_9ZZZZ
MIKTNAVSNAVMYPQHWEVSIETYLDIADLLIRKCPKWGKYYKSELEAKDDENDISMFEMIKARRQGRKA